MVQQLMGHLSSPLLSGLLANATTVASAAARPQGRLLQKQAPAPAPAAGSQDASQPRAVPAQLRAALAGRFAELRGLRVGLRARLRHERAQRRANATTAAVAGQRRLQQAEEGAAAAEALAPLVAALQTAVDAGAFQLDPPASVDDQDDSTADGAAAFELADGGRAYLPSWLLDDDVEEDAPLWSVDDWEDEEDWEEDSMPAGRYVVVMQVRLVGLMGVGRRLGRGRAQLGSGKAGDGWAPTRHLLAVPKAPPSPSDCPFLPWQESGLAPTSQMLLTDMLFLIRDAVGAALDIVAPAPAWATPYGYGPDADGPGGMYGYAGAWEAAGGDEAEGGRRRALQATQRPPLPAGEPPGALPAGAFEDSYSDEAYEAYRCMGICMGWGPRPACCVGLHPIRRNHQHIMP